MRSCDRNVINCYALQTSDVILVGEVELWGRKRVQEVHDFIIKGIVQPHDIGSFHTVVITDGDAWELDHTLTSVVQRRGHFVLEEALNTSDEVE